MEKLPLLMATMDLDYLHRRLQRQNRTTETKGRVKVYSLNNVETKQVIYIGQTRNTLEDRLRWHHYNASRSTGTSLINKYVMRYEVDIKLLKDYAVWNYTEEQLIREYLTKGAGLMNMTLGGETTVDDYNEFMYSLHIESLN